MADAILPAAGRATRMRGLPKFLLPAGPDYLTLLERHVSALLESCETIWIPTRPEQTILIESLKISSDRVIVVPMQTETMTETIMRIAGISGANRFVMIMPDTFFAGEKPYGYLGDSTTPLTLAAWSIREEQQGKLGQIRISKLPSGEVLEAEDKNPACKFPHSWGAMAFSRDVIHYFSRDMPHTGYVIPKLIEAGIRVEAKVMSGTYFDCGTPTEYLEMLRSNLS